jgi:hypothetical protein
MANVPVKMIKKVTTVAIVFSIIGLGMAWGALILEQTTLVPLQDEYFGETTKAERDAAEAGSPLAKDLAEINNLKPTILTLKLVGIATILFGIIIALLGILRMLSLMPIGLGDVIKANMMEMQMSKKD